MNALRIVLCTLLHWPWWRQDKTGAPDDYAYKRCGVCGRRIFWVNH